MGYNFIGCIRLATNFEGIFPMVLVLPFSGLELGAWLSDQSLYSFAFTGN